MVLVPWYVWEGLKLYRWLGKQGASLHDLDRVDQYHYDLLTTIGTSIDAVQNELMKSAGQAAPADGDAYSMREPIA